MTNLTTSLDNIIAISQKAIHTSENTPEGLNKVISDINEQVEIIRHRVQVLSTDDMFADGYK